MRISTFWYCLKQGINNIRRNLLFLSLIHIWSHDLIVHNYGPSRSMASIHAEVPNDVNIEISHEIIDRIEREAQRRFGIFLVIHMNPIETKDNRVMEFKKIEVYKRQSQNQLIREKEEKQMNRVITVSREFGSGGRELGVKLAESLGIPFYDKELISMAAEESDLSEEAFLHYDERIPFVKDQMCIRDSLYHHTNKPVLDI